MLTGGRVPTSAHERRAVWEGQGVVTDGLSSTVLCYRLPLDVGTAAGRVVAAYGPFEPAVLPWRLLAGGVVPSGPPSTLWVCEGPALVERVAAERLPVALLCFEGLVAHSHRQMVAAFVAAGWQVAVSADHEPRALRSAAALFEVAGRAARPWALDAAAHRRGSHDRGRDIPVGVPVPATPWDPGLAAAIRSDRRRVTEEGKVGMLLAALAESDQAT